MNGTLFLVNEHHPLDWEPAEDLLVPADSRWPEIRLHVRAKVMLEQLLHHVGATSVIRPVSGYRPRAEQQQLWEQSMAEHGAVFTRTYVARPGCSEHQTGLAIDLGENIPELDPICPSFPTDGPCGAFRRRAADFGFILRYPKGKETITGIGYEPWHFRYVGWPHARIMEEHGMVLEEYLQWLRTFPLDGPHLHYRGLGRAFEVCYLPPSVTPQTEQPHPGMSLCQCSDTNDGGRVLTLWRDAG
ncbi:M15 family metallopeptidase [Flavonifractor hominis]|uniref:M15 family metallopeptidase n=1 Tax=Flavonifractor hominis TaxID=3133178 RepID=A0ABV1ERX1_9FIRM